MRNATVGLAKSAGVDLGSSVAGFLRGGASAMGGIRAVEFTWLWLLKPACQQGIASLMRSYTSNARGCVTLARVKGELRSLRAPGHLMFALGIISDARQITGAIGRSIRSRTLRPAAAQATRSLTNWSAVWAGAELFGTGGALLGMATGPGAVVTSGVGALLGGYVGLVASEWIARRIEAPN
jgi:hypothetical protein